MSVMPRLRKPDLNWKLSSCQTLTVCFPVAPGMLHGVHGGPHYCLHTEMTPLVLRLRAQTETKSLPLLGLQLPVFGFVSLYNHVIQFLIINIFIWYVCTHTDTYRHTYPIGSVFLETLANVDTHTHYMLLANKMTWLICLDCIFLSYLQWPN